MPFVWSVAFAAVVALAVCWKADALGRALGVMDAPDGGRKRHSRPTPMVGGVALVVPLVVVAWVQSAGAAVGDVYIAIALAVTTFFLIGFIDDRRHIRPLYRLTLSFATVVATVWLVPELRVGFFRFSFAPVAIFLTTGWGVAFTAVCLVGLQNAVNMADGRNGVAMGCLLIWSVLLMPYASPHMVPVLGAMVGVLAVLLVFNLSGKVFLGDSGAYAGSIAIGLLSVRAYGVGFAELHADVVAIWFLVPVIDALRVMLIRMLKGQSPFSPDSRHFHHKLDALMPWRWGLVVYLALVAVPGTLAALYPAQTLFWAMGTLGVYGSILAAAAFNRPAQEGRRLDFHLSGRR